MKPFILILTTTVVGAMAGMAMQQLNPPVPHATLSPTLEAAPVLPQPTATAPVPVPTVDTGEEGGYRAVVVGSWGENTPTSRPTGPATRGGSSFRSAGSIPPAGSAPCPPRG